MTAFDKNIVGDRALFVVVLLLLLVSLPFTYSASGQVVFGSMGGNYTGPLIKRVIFIGASLFIMYVFAYIPYRKLNKYAYFVYVIAMVLLLITVFAGSTHNESRRVLQLDFLPFSFQTAAFAKIAMVIFAASLMARDFNDETKRIANAEKVLLAVGLMSMLTLSHGLSTTVILLFTVVSMLWVARVKFRKLSKYFGFIVIVPFLYSLVAELFNLPFRFSTWINRAVSWWQGSACEQPIGEGNYQACLSKSAIADGGFFGRGIGQSPLRYTLPEAHSDFIYSYIIDEVGFLVGIAILALYLIIFYRGIQIAKKSTSIFPMVLALGLTFLLVIQAMMNIGVSVGIFPVTGQPLPFISRGGSSLFASSVAVGILLNISRNTQENTKAKE
jgi:cell division protein FtsW